MDVRRGLALSSPQGPLNFGAHLDDVLVLQTPSNDLNPDRGIPPDFRDLVYAVSPGQCLKTHTTGEDRGPAQIWE
jgi:hypothetical protein